MRIRVIAKDDGITKSDDDGITKSNAINQKKKFTTFLQ